MEEQKEQRDSVERGRLDRLDLVTLGMLEIGVGVLLSVFGVVLHEAEREWFSSFFTHVGVGFMAAGLLTATVEALTHRRSLRRLSATQRRNREHLRRLQNATGLTILREFIPKAVFPEVQNQIIAKPFTRSGFRLEMKLAWSDPGQTRLLRRTTVSYRVKNASQTPQIFELRAVEDWRKGDRPFYVDITSVCVRRKTDASRPENLAAVSGLKREEGNALVVAEEIALQPGEVVRVVWRSEREYRARDGGPLMFTNATRGVVLDVDHPADLWLSLQVHHPDEKAVQPDVADPDHHVWRFGGGFLPFQGMTLSWFPASEATTETEDADAVENKVKVDRIAPPQPETADGRTQP